jgi:polyhydroxyalkanoate synthesis regulator phasin
MEDRSPIEAGATTRDSARKPSGFRRWIAGGMLGIALGAMLLGGTAVAQSDSDGSGLGQSFIDRLAEKLGMTPDELETTIKETQAEAIDAAVADGRLTEEQGEALKERVDSGPGFLRLMPNTGRAGTHAFRHLDINLATIASELGMTTDELRDELAAGSTLGDVITEHGSTVEEIVTTLVSDAGSELDEAVANGNLTQEQALQILANLPERLTQMIESGLPGGCERWFNEDNDSTDDAGGAEETTNQV